MRANHSHLAVVLDRSGSVGRIKYATIESFNKLIEEQRKVAGTATAQLFTFASSVEAGPVTKLEELPPLDRSSFKCKGWTHLYDSVAEAIDQTGATLAALPEDERPDKVIVAVMTDGLEAGSVNVTREQVAARIKTQTETYNWLVVFLGANCNAVEEGAKLGVARENCIRFTADNGGVRAAFHRLSNTTGNYRSGRALSGAQAGAPARITLANVVATA